MTRTAEHAEFEDLYENAPCAHFSMDEDGVITRVNQTFVAWTGFAGPEIVGRRFVDVLDKGGQIFYETRLMQALRLRGEVREVALTVRCSDGRSLPVLVNSAVATDAVTGRRSIRSAVFDATDRGNYERELLAARRSAETSETRVRILQDAASAFGAATSEVDLADALVDSAKQSFTAAAVAVMYRDASGQLLLAAGENPAEQVSGLDFGGASHEAVQRGEVVTFSDLDQVADYSAELADELRAARFEAMTIVPIVGERTPLGTLVCFFRRSQSFAQHAIDLQATLARQAAHVLERMRLQAQLEDLALHDQLTGLANRTVLHERLRTVLATSQHHQRELAVVFIDLDGFKSVNDRLGHATGDAVLRWVGTQISSAVRDDDVVGRLGGDEFIVICDDVDEHTARAVAERIRTAIDQPMDAPLAEVSITASVGVAIHRGDDASGTTLEKLFALADSGMYRSKQSGKDSVTLIRG
jgi:diguanylate cyclase (GGDEF)-like protein/PAS domain S-box-containing protein